MKNHFKVLVFLIPVVLAITHARAQQATNYAIHANIIYHFTKYINWPDSKKSGYFIIGIVGDSPLYDELKSFTSNKTVAGQKIVIRKFSSSADSYYCHILFIAEDERGSLKKIVDNTSGASILLVTESYGLARKGSCINFTIVNDRLKLEINKNNIEQRELSIATELLSLGTVVK
jgi:YfiR/HmsC-like